MKARHILVGVALMCLLLAVVPGCRKVTKANYDKIENGMTLAEVEKILGKGEVESSAAGAIGDLAGSGKVVTWESGDKSITVTFANDKVTVKTQKNL